MRISKEIPVKISSTYFLRNLLPRESLPYLKKNPVRIFEAIPGEVADVTAGTISKKKTILEFFQDIEIFQEIIAGFILLGFLEDFQKKKHGRTFG